MKDFKKHKVAYAMAVPGLIMVLLFNYMPIFGLGLAFVNYKPNPGNLRQQICRAEVF